MKQKKHGRDFGAVGRIHTFTATIERLNVLPKNYSPIVSMEIPVTMKKVLPHDVRNGKDKLVADHLWVSMTQDFIVNDIHEGDIIRFNAIVEQYVKNYRDYEIKSNGLVNLSKVERIDSTLPQVL